jgi:DNA-directed RNA polymerase subunit RPC12/RpoP
MANCPKCGKPVSWYKSITYTKWTGIKCKYCGTRCFIKRKDSYLCLLIVVLIAILFYSIFGVSIVSFLSAIVVSFSIIFTIIWNKMELEIRNNSSQNKRVI